MLIVKLEKLLPAVELSKVITGDGFTFIVTTVVAREFDESTTVMLSRYVPIAVEALTLSVTKPLPAVDVSRVIPGEDGLETETLVKVFPVFPLCVAKTVEAALPKLVFIVVTLVESKRIGPDTVRVTTCVATAPTASVTVIVSMYVAAATVAEMFSTAWPEPPVDKVIPAFGGELVSVIVRGVVPPATVNVFVAAVPDGVANVEVVALPIVITGFTVTRKKYVTTLPRVSVAVIVSR